MRPRNTIIVFVLLILIGGYLYFFEKNQGTEEPAKKLFDFKPEEVVKVDLKYPDNEITIEKQSGGKWLITKPIRTDADQTAMTNLSRAIADAELKKTIDEHPADLAPFGLDKPDTVVTVTTTKRTYPAVAIGKTTPIGFSAYIKMSDKPAVMLTSSALPPGMKKKVEDLRDRELMSFRVDDAQRVVIERPDQPPLEIVKDHGNWTIVKPVKYPADATQVRQLLSALANARVTSFITDAPPAVSQYGLERPRLSVAVYTGKEESRQSLLFGGKEAEQGKDGIYARRGERAPIYTVAGYVLQDSDKSVADLRDKTVLAFEPSQVDSIKLTTKDGAFTVKRATGGKWQIQNGKTADADVPAVERLLDSIRDLKGTSVVEEPMKDPGKYGLDSPDIQATLLSKDGKQASDIKVGKVQHQLVKSDASPTPVPPISPYDYFATSSASNAVYAVSDFNIDLISRNIDQIRSKFSTPAPSASPSVRASPAPSATPAAPPAAPLSETPSPPEEE